MSSLTEQDRQSRLVSFEGTTIAFWLHPGTNGFLWSLGSVDSEAEPADEEDPIQEAADHADKQFASLVQAVSVKARGANISALPWKEAVLLARLAGVELDPGSQTDLVRLRSSDLRYFMHRYPSPLDLRTRALRFVRYYRAALSEVDSVASLLAGFKSPLEPGSQSWVQLECAEHRKAVYVYVAVGRTLRPSTSTQDYVTSNIDAVVSDFRILEGALQPLLGDLRLATKEYWEEEAFVLLPAD